MPDITRLAELEFGVFEGEKARHLFHGARRRIVEIKLCDGDVLKRHHAAEPITVLCLAGAGTFAAGSELEKSIRMQPGTLLTLEAFVEHEVTGEPDVHFLVTKFAVD